MGQLSNRPKLSSALEEIRWQILERDTGAVVCEVLATDRPRAELMASRLGFSRDRYRVQAPIDIARFRDKRRQTGGKRA